MGFKDFVHRNVSGIITGASVVVAGAVSVGTFSGLGLGGLAIGAGAGVATLVGGNIIDRMNSKDELANMFNGTDEKNAILSLIDGQTSLEDMRSIESPQQTQLRELSEMINKVQMREHIMGDLLTPVVELLEKCANITKRDNFFNDTIDEVRFKQIISDDLPTTLELFWNSSDPARDTETRSKFREQIQLISNAVSQIINYERENRNKQVDINGVFIKDKYSNVPAMITVQDNEK